MAYHRHVPQTLITVVLLLVSVSNLGVQLVSASPIPFSEARLKEIDEMRARGVSEVCINFSYTLRKCLHHQFVCTKALLLTRRPSSSPLTP